MFKEQCFQLGQLIRKVGNDGRLLLQFDADDPSHYLKMESVFVEINKGLVPFLVKGVRMINPTQAHVRLEDVESGEQADILAGADVYLPLEALPKLSGNQFYYHEVIGFEVRNPTGESAGFITDVLENGAGDLLKLDLKGVEVLIPLADEWIKVVDRNLKCIIIDWPDGILELNAGRKS